MGTDAISYSPASTAYPVCRVGDDALDDVAPDDAAPEDIPGTAGDARALRSTPRDLLMGRSLRDLLSDALEAPNQCRAPAANTASLQPGYTREQFESEHVYSDAPAAAKKRAIDDAFIGGDLARGALVRLDNPDYLKYLISASSGGKVQVQDHGPTGKLQFFIVRGGAEGFLPAWAKGTNAADYHFDTTDTSGKTSSTRMNYDDMVAVFDDKGKLVGAARLERPLQIPGRISQKTADGAYNDWSDKDVFAYRNQTRGWVPYTGIGVRDGHRGRDVTIDMHKHEATNGCILIDDPDTPALDDPQIDTFEPKLIHDVLAAVGRSTVSTADGTIELGKMRMTTIK